MILLKQLNYKKEGENTKFAIIYKIKLLEKMERKLNWNKK